MAQTLCISEALSAHVLRPQPTCSVMPPLPLPAVLLSTKLVTLRYNMPISEIWTSRVRVGCEMYPSCCQLRSLRSQHVHSPSAHLPQYRYR